MAPQFDWLDGIVFLSAAFVVFLTVAWSLSPGLRIWIERPKFRFQESVQEFDRENLR
jgi:hypothetical protein